MNTSSLSSPPSSPAPCVTQSSESSSGLPFFQRAEPRPPRLPKTTAYVSAKGLLAALRRAFISCRMHRRCIGPGSGAHDGACERGCDRENENGNVDGIGSARPSTYNAYLLFSVRHIILCHVDGKGALLYTARAAFLNGIDAPSSAAIVLLLQGLSFTFPPPRTWVHNFPIEIQDRILEYVSEGPIEAARLGCLLNLGSPFGWMRTKDETRMRGHIERHECYTHRSEATPVESQIWFGETFSGVTYK
jgi:hypothetical protein